MIRIFLPNWMKVVFWFSLIRPKNFNHDIAHFALYGCGYLISQNIPTTSHRLNQYV